MTWRLRAQAHISPGGLSVRLSSLPAGAWSTRHTLPRTMCANAEQQWSKQVCHSPPPPPDTPGHIHTGTAASPARERHRGVWGQSTVNSPVGLVTGHPGTAAQSGPAARTVGRRPSEAFTQPNPTPPFKRVTSDHVDGSRSLHQCTTSCNHLTSARQHHHMHCTAENKHATNIEGPNLVSKNPFDVHKWRKWNKT